MKLNRIFILCLIVAAFSFSCEKDDGGGTDTIPDRDRGEQELADQEAIQEYLQTHFYNYEDFENPQEDFDYVVRFDTIDAANSDKTPIIDSELLEKKIVTRDEVDYTIYILKVREGVSEHPKFTDSTFVTYQGELLSRATFDSSDTPVWFDLVRTIPGFGQSLTEFRGASDYEINTDNTISWTNDFGVGAVFIPSGLAYFSNAQASIPAYSPLVFSIQLLAVNEADHDGDGIPSYMEDINGDEVITNDDTNDDMIPNYADKDDDGDFTLTRDEIEIGPEGITFPDTDGDGTPDYLDADNY